MKEEQDSKTKEEIYRLVVDDVADKALNLGCLVIFILILIVLAIKLYVFT